MNLKSIMNQAEIWWQEKHAHPRRNQPKSPLQRAIEGELARLARENTPLGKQISKQEKRQATDLNGASLSGIFQ